MRQNYKIILQYEGTRYRGWQKQGNAEQTIQGKLETVLSRMAGCAVEVCGSGRTDAGVHAAAQTANFFLPQAAEDEKQVMAYLNQYLPEDIRVTSICQAPDRFHSRLSAVKKTYVYRIETGQKRDVFSRRLQYELGRPLDLDSMKKAAALLLGTWDFKSFCGNRNRKKSTVRTLEAIELEACGSLIALRFTGNGFLQNMVRIMTGTLIQVGLGQRDWRTMREILEAGDRQAAGPTAPAEGLCLEQVIYQEGI